MYVVEEPPHQYTPSTFARHSTECCAALELETPDRVRLRARVNRVQSPRAKICRRSTRSTPTMVSVEVDCLTEARSVMPFNSVVKS